MLAWTLAIAAESPMRRLYAHLYWSLGVGLGVKW